MAGITGRLKEYYSKVMDLPDAPTKIARGAALGFALDFLPIPLISIPIAYVLARVVGGNGLAGALTAAFFKWVVPFFYVLNMFTGSLVIGLHMPEEVKAITVTGTTPADWLEKLAHLGYPFLAGSFINSCVAGLVLYFVVRRLLMIRQERKGIANTRKCE